MRAIILAAFGFATAAGAAGEDLKYGPVPYPAINADTWVLVEYWPTVSDITLWAFFSSSTSEKSRNLCEATKRSLDRDAAARATSTAVATSSWRKCLTVSDAVKSGYVSWPSA
jgi:hypothetical protein